MQPDLKEIFASYTSWKFNENTWIINFMGGSQNLYLLEGEERALLIDTGWGDGGLRSFAARLTQKPLWVILTHGHMDHAGGCGEWPRVMMHPGAEYDLLTLETGPFDISKLPFPNYVRDYVRDGQVLDLGGRSVELLDITAHSNGSLALLDRQNGLLFAGDEIDSAQVLLYEICPHPQRPPFLLDQRLRTYRRNLLRLRELSGQWNFLFPAHNGAPIARSYLDDYIALVEHIYDGSAVIEDRLHHVHAEAGDPEHRLCRVRWNKASFFVVKADLMELWGRGFP